MKRGRSRAALWPRSVRLDVSPEPVKHGEDGGVHRVFVIALGPLVPDDLDSRLSVILRQYRHAGHFMQNAVKRGVSDCIALVVSKIVG